MTVTKHRCETCGRETEDRYTHIGWILVEGSISISKGRRKDKSAKTAFATPKALDFCKAACLTKWLEKLTEEKVS